MKTTLLITSFASLRTLRAVLGLLLFWICAVQEALAFPPQITTQPTDQTVQVGGTAAFAVQVTSGSSLSYQWYFQSNAIARATGSSFTRTNAQLADAGAYYVAVTNADGGLHSSNAVLTVVTYPVVAVDNISTTNRNSTRTLTWSHTIGTGRSRLLLVAIVTGSSTITSSDATTVTNVTYGGTALTQVGTVAEVGNRGTDLHLPNGKPSVRARPTWWFPRLTPARFAVAPRRLRALIPSRRSAGMPPILWVPTPEPRAATPAPN